MKPKAISMARFLDRVNNNGFKLLRCISNKKDGCLYIGDSMGRRARFPFGKDRLSFRSYVLLEPTSITRGALKIGTLIQAKKSFDRLKNG